MYNSTPPIIAARPITPTTTPTAMATVFDPPPDDLFCTGAAEADCVTTTVSAGFVVTVEGVALDPEVSCVDDELALVVLLGAVSTLPVNPVR